MPDEPKLIIGDDWKRRDDSPAPAPARPTPPAQSAGAPGPAGIVVDSDWKSQAQAEKERLDAEAEKKRPADAGGGQRGSGRLPAGDFTTLVGTLVTQAVLYLGGIPDPETGRAIVSLEHARFHIDMLTALQAKTKGNLTPEEADDLQKAIIELRARFVDISHAVAEMQAKRAAGGDPGALGGGPAGPIA
ncbi:MAG: DUF1844 domain-containing protein [Phycisphaerales bacterium]